MSNIFQTKTKNGCIIYIEDFYNENDCKKIYLG